MYDSSPQGGMNWFMSHYDLIRGEDMHVFAEASQMLARLGALRKQHTIEDPKPPALAALEEKEPGMGEGEGFKILNVEPWIFVK